MSLSHEHQDSTMQSWNICNLPAQKLSFFAFSHLKKLLFCLLVRGTQSLLLVDILSLQLLSLTFVKADCTWLEQEHSPSFCFCYLSLVSLHAGEEYRLCYLQAGVPNLFRGWQVSNRRLKEPHFWCVGLQCQHVHPAQYGIHHSPLWAWCSQGQAGHGCKSIWHTSFPCELLSFYSATNQISCCTSKKKIQ